MIIENFVQILQASIAPCILISGQGLLLLSMTNRLARPIDRIRIFAASVKEASQEDLPLIREQIGILYKRCRLLQAAIAFVATSIFLVSIVMLLLFSTLIFNIQLAFSIKLFFAASLICLIVSLIFFLLDIRLTLSSIKLEVKKHFS